MQNEEQKVNNLELWDKVKQTNPAHTKKVSFGRGFTAIDPMYQVKTATELWGPYGGKWGMRDIAVTMSDVKGGDQTIATLTGTFFTPHGSTGTANSIEVVSAKGKMDDEAVKMLLTNTISKELSRVGFNADVFFGMFDDERYVAKVKKEIAEKKANSKSEVAGPEKTPEVIPGTKDDLAKMWD